MVSAKVAITFSAATFGLLLVMWLLFGSGNKHIYRNKEDEEPVNMQYQLTRYSMLDPEIAGPVDQTPKVEDEELVRKNPKGRNWKKNPSKPERIARAFMEQKFGAKFPATEPDWLINPETKRKLELDCYNEELGIAVECNGPHHYIWPNWTSATYEKFLNVVRKDDYKREMCDRRGVYLITVPYLIKPKKIGEYIESQLEAIQ